MKRHRRFTRLKLGGLGGATEEFLLVATVQNLRPLTGMRPPDIPRTCRAAWYQSVDLAHKNPSFKEIKNNHSYSTIPNIRSVINYNFSITKIISDIRTSIYGAMRVRAHDAGHG
jgi:hypothetical protein